MIDMKMRRLLCDVCRRPLANDKGEPLLALNYDRPRALARRQGWKRVARVRGGANPRPGYDLCPRCSVTETARGGL